MDNPTHFIEVWKDGDNPYCRKTSCEKIYMLNQYLLDTIWAKNKTIAIFKIKFK
jgi:hypothetical protein